MSIEVERMDQTYDEQFYDVAVKELQSDQFSEKLWSKALAKSGFDESKAKSAYVELRVEQLKGNLVLDKPLSETEEEIGGVEKKTITIEQDVKGHKLGAIMENILSNSMFIGQTLAVATGVGLGKSWVMGAGAAVGLTIAMAIPVISGYVGFTLAALFGLLGYALGNALWGETGGYWTAGIIFLLVWGKNLELVKKNRAINEL